MGYQQSSRIIPRVLKNILLKRLSKRADKAGSILIDHKNIYILPSKEGILFIVLIILMLLISINFQLNLGFLISSLFIGLLLIAMLHTYRNLYGLVLSVGKLRPVHVGQELMLPVTINNKFARQSFAISIKGSHGEAVDLDTVIKKQPINIKIHFVPNRRGWFVPGRLLVSTCYPLGWFCAWAWVDLKESCLIYPKPIASGALPTVMICHSNNDAAAGKQLGEDFHGFRDYQTGDSLNHVAWRVYASGRGLVTKQFTGGGQQHIILDWSLLSDAEIETKISRLCQWIIDAANSNLSYGLRLPNKELPIASGVKHKNACLAAIALYDDGGE